MGLQSYNLNNFFNLSIVGIPSRSIVAERVDMRPVIKNVVLATISPVTNHHIENIIYMIGKINTPIIKNIVPPINNLFLIYFKF